MTGYTKIKTQVAVIGGGLTGSVAAFELAKAGVDVTVVRDGRGASPHVAGFNVAGAESGDSTEIFIKDTHESATGLADAELVDILCNGSTALPKYLEALGFAFDTHEDGTLKARKSLGSSFARVVGKGNSSGAQILSLIDAELRQRENIKTIEGARAVRLFCQDGQVSGVLVYERATDSLTVIESPCVLLASGGYAGIFPFTSNTRDISGDTVAMALFAGAHATDMEFVQFEPSCAVWPESIRGKGMITTLFYEGATMTNALGERFMLKHSPDGERVTWYRHILLRNGGGDMSGSTISRSHIGDAYIQRLDRVLIPDVMAYAPVMTFINGEFWGTFNARDRMDPKYFEGKYGVSEEDFALLECPYPLTFGWNVDFTTANGDPAEATYFMELVNFCMQNDMSVQANYDYIAERIDLDGLIDQYCAQIYLCCSDWPSNNIKVWRNTNPDHPTMDTKWHFTIVDTDHGVGLNSDINTNLWGVINDGPVLSRIVNHMLQNQDFRERFQMRYIWCMEVAFSSERMLSELDGLIQTIDPVMQYQLDRFRCLDGGRTSWDIWYSYIETIRDFAVNRYELAKEQFKAWAGINDAYYWYLKNRAMEEWGSEVS